MATQSATKDFIEKIAPLITAEAKKRGYKTWAAVIAQAIIESGSGQSGLAKYNNLFGMKCGSSWKGTSVNMKTKEEYKVGVLTTINDNFRTYPTLEAGISGYYDFISAKRYANLKTASNYIEYATNLKLDKYATSNTYVSTLCNTVLKYGLTAYEGKYPTLKKGSSGQYVKVLQQKLNEHKIMGGNLKIDGEFGANTLNAVIEFQALRGLDKDGIVGAKTWECLNDV